MAPRRRVVGRAVERPGRRLPHPAPRHGTQTWVDTGPAVSTARPRAASTSWRGPAVGSPRTSPRPRAGRRAAVPASSSRFTYSDALEALHGRRRLPVAINGSRAAHAGARARHTGTLWAAWTRGRLRCSSRIAREGRRVERVARARERARAAPTRSRSHLAESRWARYGRTRADRDDATRATPRRGPGGGGRRGPRPRAPSWRGVRLVVATGGRCSSRSNAGTGRSNLFQRRLGGAWSIHPLE